MDKAVVDILQEANAIVRNFHPCQDCEFFGANNEYCSTCNSENNKPFVTFDRAIEIIKVKKLNELISLIKNYPDEKNAQQ